MLLARRSSTTFSYTPLDSGSGCTPPNKKNNVPTTLPLITLTESLLSTYQYENINSNSTQTKKRAHVQRQRSRSINVLVPQSQLNLENSTEDGSLYNRRRAKTPSPKRTNYRSLNSPRSAKTPSPRSLSPKYSSSSSHSRRSSNASLASSGNYNKLDVDISWEEFGNLKKWKTPSQSPQRTLSNLEIESLELFLKTYRLALVGAEGTGKKSLLSSFGEEEEPTSPNLSITIQDETYDFAIKVVNDPNAFDHLYKYDGLIFVYSITDRSSFKFARRMIEKIENEGKIIFLVGNKCDLERRRSISASESISLCNKFSNLKYIETSVSLNIHIDELKETIFRQLGMSRTVSLVKQNLIEKLINWGNRKWKSCLDINIKGI